MEDISQRAPLEPNGLLENMASALDPREWVFCSLPSGVDASDALFTFQENEGLTVVVEHGTAHERGWDHTFVCKRITLTVNSSLEAVGFLAAITAKLAQAGIACNAVSAYHHDHLFVPAVLAEEAMRILRQAQDDSLSAQDDTVGSG